MNLKFSRICEVKAPVRGTEKSAGIDFFVPVYDAQFRESFKLKNSACTKARYSLNENRVVVPAHSRVIIPSGVKVNLPPDTVLVGFNKGGVATKKGLDLLACVVDEDFQGEVFISMVNTSDSYIIIDENTKITQFVLLPVNYPKLEETSEEDLYTEESERGDGCMGSTGD